MTGESLIIALIYIERLIIMTGVNLTLLNWRLIVKTSLTLSSFTFNIGSRDSYIANNLKTSNNYYEQFRRLELFFIKSIDYNLAISLEEYAKYFYILNEFA